MSSGGGARAQDSDSDSDSDRDDLTSSSEEYASSDYYY